MIEKCAHFLKCDLKDLSLSFDICNVDCIDYKSLEKTYTETEVKAFLRTLARKAANLDCDNHCAKICGCIGFNTLDECENTLIQYALDHPTPESK